MNKISVVIPMYYEEEVAEECYKRVKDVLTSLENYEHEIIFVNDGSKDKTLEILEFVFFDICSNISGIGSYVYLIFVLKILSAFLNSFSSFTLFLYLFDTNIPISEHDKNINVYITIFNPNIV